MFTERVHVQIKLNIFNTFPAGIFPWNPASATCLALLCTAITGQTIELESCSNPLKMLQVF